MYVERVVQEGLQGEHDEVGNPTDGERQNYGRERYHGLRIARRHFLFVMHVAAPATVVVVVAVQHGSLYASADPRHLVDLLHLLARDP